MKKSHLKYDLKICRLQRGDLLRTVEPLWTRIYRQLDTIGWYYDIIQKRNGAIKRYRDRAWATEAVVNELREENAALRARDRAMKRLLGVLWHRYGKKYQRHVVWCDICDNPSADNEVIHDEDCPWSLI